MVSFDVSRNTLLGSVPLEILSLTELRSLDLAQTFLEGTDIFPGVLSLSSLRELRLSNTILSGSVPSYIGQLTALESLWFDDTRLTGLLPSEVGVLTALTDLRVAHNFVSGTIPSEIGRLSKLTSLRFGSNNLASTFPTEICLLTHLEKLGVSGNSLSGVIPTEVGMLSQVATFLFSSNSFSGTIPSEAGHMAALLDLDLSFNALSGSIPTDLGQLPKLTKLYLDGNMLTGVLPSELGLLSDLGALYLGENLSLSGELPHELGLLSKLSVLDVTGNQLVGSLPSEIGQLSHLEMLVASDNLLTGTLPSEMGQMESLKRLHLANNPLSGSIPPELFEWASDLVDFIADFNIVGTEITGSIPEGFCRRIQDLYEQWGHSVVGLGATVDCNNVVCSCCGCPTPMPSVSPSSTFNPTRMPSTSAEPSGSFEPTIVPSLTIEPSASLLPSRLHVSCSNFSSIAHVGAPLGISGKDEHWRGQVAYSAVAVTTNGVVFPGGDVFDDGCCDPEPIAPAGRYEIPRIAVAHSDLGSSGYIYTAHVDDAFIISWERVTQFWEVPQIPLDFQVLLFENGNIEMRWGEGNAAYGVFAAGLEDDPAGMVVASTGAPFDDLEPGSGIFSRWPGNQCRAFAVSSPGYIEVIPHDISEDTMS